MRHYSSSALEKRRILSKQSTVIMGDYWGNTGNYTEGNVREAHQACGRVRACTGVYAQSRRTLIYGLLLGESGLCTGTGVYGCVRVAVCMLRACTVVLCTGQVELNPRDFKGTEHTHTHTHCCILKTSDRAPTPPIEPHSRLPNSEPSIDCSHSQAPHPVLRHARLH